MTFLIIAVVVLGLVWFLSRRGGTRPQDDAAEPTSQMPSTQGQAKPVPRAPAVPSQGAAPSRVAPASPARPAQPTPAQSSMAQNTRAATTARPAARPAPAVGTGRPPGTRDLDDPDAVRPDIDARALATARAAVTPTVPDAVLSDALLDASPEQLSRMIAAVPTEVMSQALGKDAPRKDDVRPLRAEDRQQLSGLGDALDDLDIWNFGEDSAKA